MNLDVIRTIWEDQRLATGVTIRAIQAIPADKVDARPVRDMRSAKELVCHLAATMKHVASGIPNGRIEAYEAAEKDPSVKTPEDLIRVMQDAWKTADAAVQGITAAKATAPIETPWNFSPPAWMCVQIIADEHYHHRGQLYAYLRAFGIEPPFMWSFENNAPEFQPKQHAPA
jgi:uncharacterized damage-inducible protein DinB